MMLKMPKDSFLLDTRFGFPEYVQYFTSGSDQRNKKDPGLFGNNCIAPCSNIRGKSKKSVSWSRPHREVRVFTWCSACFNKADRHKSRARDTTSHYAKKSKAGPTDRRTDRRTDTVTCRVACTRLKTRPYTRHKMRPRPALRHFQRFL